MRSKSSFGELLDLSFLSKYRSVCRMISDSASFYAADACPFTRIIDRFPELSSGISETASTNVVNSSPRRLARVECRC